LFDKNVYLYTRSATKVFVKNTRVMNYKHFCRKTNVEITNAVKHFNYCHWSEYHF